MQTEHKKAYIAPDVSLCRMCAKEDILYVSNGEEVEMNFADLLD